MKNQFSAKNNNTQTSDDDTTTQVQVGWSWRDTIALLTMILVIILLMACEAPECPEHERVIIRYDTVVTEFTTTTTPVTRCPISKY